MAKNLYIFDCFGVVISNVSGLWMNKRLNAEQQEFMCKNVFRSIDTGKTSMEWMFDIICEKFGMQKETVKRVGGRRICINRYCRFNSETASERRYRGASFQRV